LITGTLRSAMHPQRSRLILRDTERYGLISARMATTFLLLSTSLIAGRITSDAIHTLSSVLRDTELSA